MTRTSRSCLALWMVMASLTAFAQKKDTSKKTDSLKNTSLGGLAFRSIGPAVTGGRVVALAVNPFNHAEYYVGAGHGSLWKTENNGVTFTPVFDHEHSYAIGAIAIDPTNPHVVWVGTGENDNQSNVIYGDGVYKSEDGGKSWTNMGLKNSGHIGGIVVDPTHPQTVYVAAYGHLRKSGGDRGIYKTTDGGKTWKQVLKISPYTGCYEIHMDPRYPNILYAVAHQRMTRLFTAVRGGPQSGIYRSTDSGNTWEKMTTGLPTGDIGRIGLSISPANPDVLYAIVEAVKEGGIYKSTDRGVSWKKENGYVSSYPFYFQKLFCDPRDVDRVYSMDVYMKVTIDGGKTWEKLGEDKKHPDNHVLWIDPSNPRHMIDGCDGGLYDTYDRGATWEFKSNLPIAEIYKVTTDNASPFYNVYAGAQDNNSFFGPSRTLNSSGITNGDWTFTASGDGFQTQVDWSDPSIVYSESQNGDLERYDKKTGEMLFIKPVDFNDTAYRFDWSTPLLISHFNHRKLYFGANKLFVTEDQGNSWKVISPDLTRGVPKKMLKLMDQSWSINDLAGKGSLGQIASVEESPLDSSLLFTGSGDGLIHYSDDGGRTWHKASTPGLPEYARIDQIVASRFDRNLAYAACENFSDGDDNPYLYKTTDGGKSWLLSNGNLPDSGSIYTLAEDEVDRNLLFAGTQYGVYFTNDGGKNWIALKDGIPTECVKSLVIQRREHDLVVSTFGRGIYILDDYTPLRELTPQTLEKDGYLFKVNDARMYVQANPFAFRSVGFQGAGYYSASNPEPGAVFTYYLKKEIKSLKDQRIDSEKVEKKKGEEIKFPTYEERLAETEEPKAYLLFTIRDAQGNVVRKIKEAPKKGVQRITWDFRYPPFTPVSFTPFDNSIPWNDPPLGYMVVPGKYTVTLSEFAGGKFSVLAGPREFTCTPLHQGQLSSAEEQSLEAFNRKVASLTTALSGADAYRKSLVEKIKYLEKGFFEGSGVPQSGYDSLIAISKDLDAFNWQLNGNGLLAAYQGGVPTSVKGRVDIITSGLWTTTAAPTATFRELYEVAASQFTGLLTDLKSIDGRVRNLEGVFNQYGAPYTPDRFPVWQK